jgi:hypothetical protein
LRYIKSLDTRRMKIQSFATYFALLGMAASVSIPRRKAANITNTITTVNDAEPTTAAMDNALNVSNTNILAEASDYTTTQTGLVPYGELPECYRECFDLEAKNTNTGRDVRTMTADEFCHTEYDITGPWINNKWFPCAHEDKCKKAGCLVIHGCGNDVKKWAKKTCGYMGRPHF